ncbi:MAG: leucine-rich repeat domain-containing protein, partial [Oscillospiraceae bacterium]|nr:leucine-rich repeat domain-containing protein [Oscillospiraceae bacterium]
MKHRLAAAATALTLLTGTAPAPPVQTVLTAQAEEIASGHCANNLTWVLKNGTLTISGEGMLKSSNWEDHREQIKSVVIEEGVTAISYGIFEDHTSLTSVSLPKSLSRVHSAAFVGCTSLKEIKVDPENTWLKAVDGVLYGYVLKETYGYAYTSKNQSTDMCLTSYPPGKSGTCSVQEGTVLIDDESFKDCTGLENVTIPGSVKEIAGGAFWGCTNLRSISIPDNVTTIGQAAFLNCSSLTSIRLPKDLETIESSTCHGCSSLRSITIPDSVTSIGKFAFMDCTSLTSVDLPESLTTIGNYAFEECKSLRSVTIPDSVESIGYSAFADCSSLTSVKIGSGLTEIGENTFSSCPLLENIDLGPNVSLIDKQAFACCKSLTSLTFPDSLETIGNRAFSSCTGLKNVRFGNGLTTIGERAFGECWQLHIVLFGSQLESIGQDAFSGCDECAYGITESWDVENGDVHTEEYYTLSNKYGYVRMPASMKSLDSGAFGESGYASIVIESMDCEFYDSGNTIGRIEYIWDEDT